MAPNALARAMAWMTGELQRHAGAPVEYERIDPATGEVRTLRVMAVKGRTAARREAAVAPVDLDADAADFLIAASELALDGERFEPRPDDLVKVAAGGRTEVYKLLPQGANPPWRWADSTQTLRRIHTKLFDSIASP